MHRVQAHINLSALKSNFQLARDHSGHARMVAVIKANAYGHGLIPVANALSAADMFAVTDLSEAMQLTEEGIDKPVLILQGYMAREEIRAIGELGLQVVIHSAEQLDEIDAEFTARPPTQPLIFWLKLDSGMGRLGMGADGYATAWRKLKQRPYTQDVVMMTHLANISLPGASLNGRQLENFQQVFSSLADQEPATSIASSAGILSDLPIAADWARPGIMLYGSSPFPYSHEALRAEALGLRPVMTLQTRLIAIKDLKQGDNVGYASQYICPHDMRIGIAAIGYADGYPSNAPNGTPVLVKGIRSETTGRVSMDMLAVDLSHIPDAKIGDSVTLWGKGLAMDEIAARTGILSYNLTCSVARRVRFLYHDL